jgi:FtsZ-binding cell division protein ZapB
MENNSLNILDKKVQKLINVINELKAENENLKIEKNVIKHKLKKLILKIKNSDMM